MKTRELESFTTDDLDPRVIELERSSKVGWLALFRLIQAYGTPDTLNPRVKRLASKWKYCPCSVLPSKFQETGGVPKDWELQRDGVLFSYAVKADDWVRSAHLGCRIFHRINQLVNA